MKAIVTDHKGHIQSYEMIRENYDEWHLSTIWNCWCVYVWEKERERACRYIFGCVCVSNKRNKNWEPDQVFHERRRIGCYFELPSSHHFFSLKMMLNWGIYANMRIFGHATKTSLLSLQFRRVKHIPQQINSIDWLIGQK